MISNPLPEPEVELNEPIDEKDVEQKWEEPDLIKYIESGPSGLMEYEALPQNIELSEGTSEQIYQMGRKLSTPMFMNTRDCFHGTFYNYHPKGAHNNKLFMDALLYRGINIEDFSLVEESYPPPPEFLMPILDRDRYIEGKAQGCMFIGSCGTFLALRAAETMVLWGNPVSPFYAREVILPNKFKPNIPPISVYGPKESAIRSMRQFLSACNWYRIAVYAAQQEATRHSPSYTRIDNKEYKKYSELCRV